MAGADFDRLAAALRIDLPTFTRRPSSPGRGFLAQASAGQAHAWHQAYAERLQAAQTSTRSRRDSVAELLAAYGARSTPTIITSHRPASSLPCKPAAADYRGKTVDSVVLGYLSG